MEYSDRCLLFFASFCGMVRSYFLDQVTVRLFLSNVRCVRRGDPPFSCLLINPLYPPHLYFLLQGENSLELHCLCLVLLLSLRWSGCGYVLHDVGPVGYAGWMMSPRSCRQYEWQCQRIPRPPEPLLMLWGEWSCFSLPLHELHRPSFLKQLYSSVSVSVMR